jgi:hypothetical protein
MGQQEPECAHSSIRVTMEVEWEGVPDWKTKEVELQPGFMRHWTFICNQCQEEVYDLGVSNHWVFDFKDTPETPGGPTGATPAPGTSAGDDYEHVDSEAVLKYFRELRPDLSPSYEYPGFFSVDLPGGVVCVAFGDIDDTWGGNYTDREGEGFAWGGWDGELSTRDRDPQWVAAELAKACDPANVLPELRRHLEETRKLMETAVSLEREEELNEEEGLLVKAIAALEEKA